GTTNEVAYQFTGQEFDESGVHNYRARLYDSDLGKFYAIDPAGQGWSPFAYAGNNPVIYVDKDGNFWFVVAAVAIAGGLNVYQNWDQIENPGDALGYFGLGAASGALSTTGPVGWFLGGAITGAGNTALGGGGFESILQNGFVGGFSGLAGGYGGQAGSKLGTVINGTSINSPFLSGLIGGGLGGAGGGFAAGFTGSLLTGGTFNNALTAGLSGARSGLAVGAPVGAGAASIQAHKSGLNALTGKFRSSFNTPDEVQIALTNTFDSDELGMLKNHSKNVDDLYSGRIRASDLNFSIEAGGTARPGMGTGHSHYRQTTFINEGNTVRIIVRQKLWPGGAWNTIRNFSIPKAYSPIVPETIYQHGYGVKR
ncbi:RHS repeat-associated core domain-containing protein, partial [candidate division KSB1 bacterium]